jgi:glycosyltransferase involved in cell wall biosynthesis
VVVASKVGPPFIDDCLASLEKEAQTLDAEVIVVACGARDYAERIQQKFPWVKLIHRAQPEGVPSLRGCGVAQAKGDIVAVIEEHCLAANDWLHQALAAHKQGNYSAVGGPIVDYDYPRLRDWVVYFCEYSNFLPPAPAGEAANLNGANIAYKRQALMQYNELLGSGYWEASLHPVLLANGARFLSMPRMVVHHRGPFNFGYYLRQRYLFSRAFAGARAKMLPASRRLAYLLAAPLVPGILLARMASRVWEKRCHVGKFVRSLPLIVPALMVVVAGEWVGYLAGPGDALAKVE